MKHVGPTTGGIALIMWVAVTSLGCLNSALKPYRIPEAPAAPDQAWQPPAEIQPSHVALPDETLPSDLGESADRLTLWSVIDLALRNSPETARTWSHARSMAAAAKSETSNIYPKLDASFSVNRNEGSFANGEISYFQRSYQPGVEMSWLLYDFGGREAGIDEKRQALIAAGFTHNATIQDIIVTVEIAYFDYLTNKALLTAQTDSLAEAKTLLDAAEERHRVGLATIADVLQAKTGLAQAQLELDRLTGLIQTTRGVLATAMGLPPNTPYDIDPEIPAPKLDETMQRVDGLLERAQQERPDLAAARAEAEGATAHLRRIRADRYPVIKATGSASRVYYNSADHYGNTTALGLSVKLPVFSGFAKKYNVIQAEADRDAALAGLRALEQAVTLEVWSAYHDLQTARQRVATSETLLESATQSYDVAVGRYHAGVGTMLDMLSAQSALEDARAQRVLALSDWNVALAQLAHATGALSIAESQNNLATPISVEKEQLP